MIMTLIIQGKYSDVANPTVYLQLAEKFIRRSIDSKAIHSHNEIHVYLELLEQLCRYDEALNLLESNEIINIINQIDYEHHYFDKKLMYSVKLDDWKKTLEFAKLTWKNDPDEWKAWSSLSELVFIHDENNHLQVSNKSRFMELGQLIKASMDDPKVNKKRSTFLALMDYFLNIKLCRIDQPPFMKPLIEILKSYAKIYRKKEIFAMDICQVVNLGLEKSDQEKFCKEFLAECLQEFNNQSKESLMEKNCDPLINAFRLLQFNGFHPSLNEIFPIIFSTNSSINGNYNVDYNEILANAEKTKDLGPFDPLIHLSIQLLAIMRNDTSNKLNVLLLAYHWLNFIATKFSPFDHHSKILLIRLLSTAGGLFAPRHQLRLMNFNRIKLSLTCSTSHLMVQPELSLTCWGPSISSTSSAGDPGISQSLNNSRIITNPISKSDMDNENSIRRRRNTEFMTSIDDFYAKLRKLRISMMKDTDDALANAFESGSYAQILEIIQLYNLFKFSTVHIHGVVELSFWRSVILPFSFDQLHEEMTNILHHNELLDECLPKLKDNRDDFIVPSFERRPITSKSKEKSHQYISSWLRLRNTANKFYGNVLIPVCNRFINGTTPGDQDRIKVTNEINAIISVLEEFEVEYPRQCHINEMFTSKKHEHVRKLDELIFNEPVVIGEDLSLIQLYLHGGFTQLLRYTLTAMQSLNDLKKSHPKNDDSLHGFNESLDGIHRMIIGKESILDKLIGISTALDIPAAIKQATYIFECISFITLFISSIVSIIKPLTKSKSDLKRAKGKAQQVHVFHDDFEMIGQKLCDTLVKPFLANDSVVKRFAFHLKGAIESLKNPVFINSIISNVTSFAKTIFPNDLLINSGQVTATTAHNDGIRHRDTASSSTDNENKNPKDKNDEHQGRDTTGSFECNICLDTAKNAVVSMCGHLFCWPCIHEWMTMSRNGSSSSCPVCKSVISKDKMIPLYGRGADCSQDPRGKIPPRPQGRRTEQDQASWTPFGGGFANFFGFNNFGQTPGFHVGGNQGAGNGDFNISIGIGAFPFGFFSWFPSSSNDTQSPMSNINDSEWMSKVFLCIAVFFLILLFLA